MSMIHRLRDFDGQLEAYKLRGSFGIQIHRVNVPAGLLLLSRASDMLL